MNSKTKASQIIFVFVKTAIFLLTLYYIYYRFHDNNTLNDLLLEIKTLPGQRLLLIALVLLMMVVNWGIESLKWQILINKIERITYLKSYKAVLGGITINNWIPNRMAEFAGRILFLKAENRIKAIVSTLVGGYSQLIMTLLAGSAGFIIWLQSPSRGSLLIIIIAAVFVNTMLIASFLKISWFVKFIHRIRFLGFLSKYIEILNEYSNRELRTILSLSFIRYFVFMFQYFILLRTFSINVELITGLSGVAFIFGIQAAIPSVTLTEIGIRGATILWVFERFSNNLPGLLCAAYSLWIINIIIPTILGAIFILTMKGENEKKSKKRKKV